MADFSVDYDGIQNVIAEQERMAKVFSQNADHLFKIMNSVGWNPSLSKKGYTKKLWSAYSNIANRQGNIGILSSALSKINDTYLNCENKVIQEMEDEIITENGFSKQSTKIADKAEKKSKKTVKKETQKKTFKERFDESFEESTKGSAKQVSKIINGSQDIRENAGKAAAENFLGWLKDEGVPETLVDKIREKGGEINNLITNYEDVVYGVLNCNSVEGRYRGSSGLVSLFGFDPETGRWDNPVEVTGFGENNEVINEILDLFGNDSYILDMLDIYNESLTDMVMTGDVDKQLKDLASFRDSLESLMSDYYDLIKSSISEFDGNSIGIQMK